MNYDCMTADELALWRAGSIAAGKRTGSVAKRPCTDCPLSFRLQAYLRGTCRLPAPVVHKLTDERRAYNREWMRMARARGVE